MKSNFFAQDPSVLPAQVITVPGAATKPGPEDARIVVIDRPQYPKAKSDSNGNFLYDSTQPQFDACEIFDALKKGMALYCGILQRGIPFAFPGKVRLLPHDGEGINAFYSRNDKAVHFLDMRNPKLGKLP